MNKRLGIQTPDRVFEQIGLTSINPAHPQSLFNSCHARTARCIHEHRSEIEDTDTIVLFGYNGVVYHSVLMRGADIIFDCAEGNYDHDSRTYSAENWRNETFKENIGVVATCSVCEAQESAAEKFKVQLPYNSANKHTPSEPGIR